DGFGDLRELFTGGGSINVSRNNQRAMAMVREPPGKFAGGGGFAGALQADDHPDGRRARCEERLGMFAEKIAELIANDLDDLLIGRELQHDFAAERLLANVGEEFVNDADGDVAFEEGFANFGERSV